MGKPEDDGEYRECVSCCGSGLDNSAFDGRCVQCSGKGEYWVDYPNDEYDNIDPIDTDLRWDQ
jgi:hypothetical protein